MNRLSKKLACLPAAVLATLFMNCVATPAIAQSVPAEGLPGGPNPKAVMMYNLGITAYKQGSTDAAVIFFKRACDIDPNLADAQYNLAVIYQSQRRYKEAIPRFEEVLRIKPNDPDAHFQLGAILQESGRYPEARQYFSAIAPNSNHFPEAQRRLGQLNAAMSGQPVTQPPVNTQPAYTPTDYAAPATNSAYTPPPYTAAPPAQNPYAPPAQTAIAPYNPPAVTATPQIPTNPSAQPDTSVSSGAQPGQGSAQGVSAAPPVSPNPVSLMANSSLRVVATGFNAPAGLAFDRVGNLYVANYLTNTIDRIAPDGTRTQFSSGATLRGPIGLITDEIGNVYVANYNGGTVAKINPAGVSTVIASGFKKPYYLTLDRDGNLYVSQQEDNSIVRITLPRQAAALKTP